MNTIFLCNPLIPLRLTLNIGNNKFSYHLGVYMLHNSSRGRPMPKSSITTTTSCTRLDNNNNPQNQEQQQQQQTQLNLSVLRFTFGIPGLDESYLPRWIGYSFGFLLLLNHFLGSESAAAITTPAQLRTEILGLSLAAFSVAIPYLGKYLEGANQMDQKVLPEGAEQIFLMSQNISATLKEDLAWGTYIILRNTNTISVLISIPSALCVRGYWNTPEDGPKNQVLDWFEKEIQHIGLPGLKETLYFPKASDTELWKMLPRGTRSVLVQPVLQVPEDRSNQMENAEGFVLLASSSNYAYSNKDAAWIKAIANKFRGKSICA